MKQEIIKIFNIVSKLNDKKNIWSHLTSIEYMLKSDLYMESMMDDRDTVKKLAIASKPKRILDFGTGSGIFAVLVRNKSKKVKIDAIDTYVNTSQKDRNFRDTVEQQTRLWDVLGKKYKIGLSHYNGLEIPFKDKTFDVINAYAVIEHIHPKDLSKVLKEIYRVLKPERFLFIFKCPRSQSWAERAAKLIGFGAHDILYPDKEIKNLFEKHHFKIIKYWRSDMIFEFPSRITNTLYNPLRFLDNLLSSSPLNIFAHHNNLVLKKTKNE